MNASLERKKKVIVLLAESGKLDCQMAELAEEDGQPEIADLFTKDAAKKCLLCIDLMKVLKDFPKV